MRATRSVFSGGVVLILLALAVVLGYLTDFALTKLDKIRYPCDFEDTVAACAEEFELDEYMIFATIQVLSGFSSNHISDDGRIGLMQLSEETFLWLTNEKRNEGLDKGLLYEPATNIRYGSYYLLYLTTRYDNWDAVFAAYLCGTEIVDGWYTEWKSNENPTADFVIKDDETAKTVNKIQRTIEKYHEIYQQKGETTS